MPFSIPDIMPRSLCLKKMQYPPFLERCQHITMLVKALRHTVAIHECQSSHVIAAINCVCDPQPHDSPRGLSSAILVPAVVHAHDVPRYRDFTIFHDDDISRYSTSTIIPNSDCHVLPLLCQLAAADPTVLILEFF